MRAELILANIKCEKKALLKGFTEDVFSPLEVDDSG